jgi:predicted N-acetyltransferase YhbS
MNGLSYHIETNAYPLEVADVYRRSGIARPLDDLTRLTQMLQHANLMVSARDQGRMVGFARALTDFCYCCYLSDLAVDRDYQQRGIGRELLYTMQHKLGDEVMVCLLSAPEAMPFYPNAGFQQAGQAWWIPRKR